jgi:hypothetical protein
MLRLFGDLIYIYSVVLPSSVGSLWNAVRCCWGYISLEETQNHVARTLWVPKACIVDAVAENQGRSHISWSPSEQEGMLSVLWLAACITSNTSDLDQFLQYFYGYLFSSIRM